MKKILVVLLTVLCIAGIVACISGCKEEHTHSFDRQVTSEDYLASPATCTERAKYYFSCECGENSSETFEYGDPLGHNYGAASYVWGEDYSKCVAIAVCSHNAVHTFVEAANSTSEVTQNKSCLLDEETTYTVSFANELFDEQTKVVVTDTKTGHTYSDKWESDNNYHWHNTTCEHIGETSLKEKHIESDWIIDVEATSNQVGHRHKECTVCKKVVKTEELPKLAENKITFNTLTFDDSNTAYAKVSNAQTTYNFANEITVSGNAEFIVSLDINGIYRSFTNSVPLTEGDNTFYIIESVSGKTTTYIVTIRRRPMYTVSFDTNGGTTVASQRVEEDSFATEPNLPEKLGYTFDSWDYNFTQAITSDTYINAKWTANTDTPYKVEYYLENIDDSDYTLRETVNLLGTTDKTANAEQKAYEHFTLNTNKSVLIGNITGNGSLVLKLYYTRNKYSLSNENTSYGEITNATTQKYGNATVKSVAAEYLGCEFIGWFNEEKLLSSKTEYDFTIEYNVTAKFKVKEEMSNFEFNSSVDTCEILGLKDKNVSEILIQNYVMSIGDYAFV